MLGVRGARSLGESADFAAMPNQTNADGTTPAAAKSSGSRDYGGELSWLTGQRMSACTCPGDPHPGPSNNVGRGSPEIDILEAQVDYHGYGTASQSLQIAPFDAGYMWNNLSSAGMTIYNPAITILKCVWTVRPPLTSQRVQGWN